MTQIDSMTARAQWGWIVQGAGQRRAPRTRLVLSLLLVALWLLLWAGFLLGLRGEAAPPAEQVAQASARGAGA